MPNVSKIDVHTYALKKVGVEMFGVVEDLILEEDVALRFSATM
jgi:hypothetical protein